MKGPRSEQGPGARLPPPGMRGVQKKKRERVGERRFRKRRGRCPLLPQNSRGKESSLAPSGSRKASDLGLGAALTSPRAKAAECADPARPNWKGGRAG